MPILRAKNVAVVDKMACDSCGLCLPLCPPMAIWMRRDGLVIHSDTCTGCEKCIDPCPLGALTMLTIE